MLRGNSPAKVDDKGRIKIPTNFRKYIEERFGRDCFVTSLSGEYVRIYPMPVWLEIEKKIAALPSMNPTITRFLNHVNYYGQPNAMDDQGRILIHPLLRQRSEINGEVAVLGHQTYLDIWNREKFESMLAAQPLTDEDKRILASLGI
ncbi:MAG: division/cell wall cluster transcriptional repressor MraZ [Acidobacteriota bacterium]